MLRCSPLFYASLYSDLRGKTREQLIQHWRDIGCQHNRVGCDVDKKVFDMSFYCKEEKMDFPSVLEAKKHWYTRGKIGGGHCSQEYRNGLPVVVLTRTSNRAYTFSQCCRSVHLQTYGNIYHFVSYDRMEDEIYVKEYLRDQDACFYMDKNAFEGCSYPYNLYINELCKRAVDKFQECWFVVLDDDDRFATSHALAVIMRQVSLSDTICSDIPLYMWKTRMSETDTLPIYSKNNMVRPNNVPSCSFLFHSSYTESIKWKGEKGGDSAFAMNVCTANKNRVVWIPFVGCSLQFMPGGGTSKTLLMNILHAQNLKMKTVQVENYTYASVHGPVTRIDKSEGEKDTVILRTEGEPFTVSVSLDALPTHLLHRDYIQDSVGACYILNLKRRPDRLRNVENRLREKGIFKWDVFYGIDGQQYKKEFAEYKKKQTPGTRQIPSVGSYAILLSMSKMIRDAQKKNLSQFLVLQDDVLLCKDFPRRFWDLYQTVTRGLEEWKLIYLGCTQHKWPERTNACTAKEGLGWYYPQGTTEGAFAVVIHSSAYAFLLNEIDKTLLPFDSGPMSELQKKYPEQCVSAWPYLMIADLRDSDCRPGRNQEHFSRKFKWNLDDFTCQ